MREDAHRYWVSVFGRVGGRTLHRQLRNGWRTVAILAGIGQASLVERTPSQE
jgi:hypothetical protein